MQEYMIHLIMVWPDAISQLKSIETHLKENNANILYGLNIHSDIDNLEKFITGIYSGSQYDVLHLNKKKEGVLNSYLPDKGVIAILFTIMHDKIEWNNERGRFVYPDILNLKEIIREDIKAKLGNVSVYETIHLTDDWREYENDFSCLIRLICSSKCEYYPTDKILQLNFG